MDLDFYTACILKELFQQCISINLRSTASNVHQENISSRDCYVLLEL